MSLRLQVILRCLLIFPGQPFSVIYLLTMQYLIILASSPLKYGRSTIRNPYNFPVAFYCYVNSSLATDPPLKWKMRGCQHIGIHIGKSRPSCVTFWRLRNASLRVCIYRFCVWRSWDRVYRFIVNALAVRFRNECKCLAIVRRTFLASEQCRIFLRRK